MFADIHCHTTLRAINTPEPESGKNPWENTDNLVHNTTASRWARMQSREIAKYSQANLYRMAEAGVRIIFDSLYPVEKGFLHFRRFPNLLLSSKNRDEAMITALGVEPHRLTTLRKRQDYFPELQEQYTFLSKHQGKSPDRHFHYEIATGYKHLKEILAQGEDALAIVLTIEGAHAFGAGCESAKKLHPAELRERLTENIRTVKAWHTPPFFVNLAHHYHNQLCGHAKSFKPPIHLIFDQKAGINRGISELGWHVLEEMLSRGNGKRMLIDIKHMSLQSRTEYYEFVRRQNRISPDDKIPVICSHTGVSGITSFREQKKNKDSGKALRSSRFNSWSINLCDEEIRFIAASGGLIGIMMDKGMLAGQGELDRIKAMKSEQDRKRAFLTIISENIFRVIHAAGAEGWNTIALGTDYDGLITHFDCYPDSGYLPQLKTDLEELLSDKSIHPQLRHGLSPREITERLFLKNAMRFLRRNF